MQKITPFLWFNNEAEEAARFYTFIFKNSSIGTIRRYGDAGPAPRGSVMTLTFQLEGLDIMALNGGPLFTFTPSISFFVSLDTEQEIDTLWSHLSKGGKALMELASYPFSQKFGWVQDRFGLTWQLNLAHSAQRISPFLMYVGQHGRAEKAMHFYTSLFKNSRISAVARFTPGEPGIEGSVKHAVFSLEELQFMAMDSNRDHSFTFNEAVSLLVNCETQQEVDLLWEQLSEGGVQSQCGWLKDRYGVSWQIIPSVLGRMLGDPDPARSGRVMKAMLQMRKIDTAALERAYHQE